MLNKLILDLKLKFKDLLFSERFRTEENEESEEKEIQSQYLDIKKLINDYIENLQKEEKSTQKVYVLIYAGKPLNNGLLASRPQLIRVFSTIDAVKLYCESIGKPMLLDAAVECKIDQVSK